MMSKVKNIIFSSCLSLMALINLQGIPVRGKVSTSSYLYSIIQSGLTINILQFLGLAFILYICSDYLYKKQVPLISNIFNWIYSVVFSFVMVYGILFAQNRLWMLFSGSRSVLLLTLIKIVGIAIVVNLLLLDIEKYFIYQYEYSIPANSKTWIHKDIPWYGWLILIFICWLPYLILFYPGIANPDSLNQLGEFFGHGSWVRDDYPIGWYLLGKHPFSISNQHDFLVTLLYGSNVKLGIHLLDNAAAGFFINSLLQTILMISIYVYALATFKRLGLSNKQVNIIGIFFAIFPLNPIISMFVTKNILYTFFLVWSILLLANAINNNAYLQKKSWWVAFVISLLGQMASQKYAIYIILLVALYYLIFWFKEKNYLHISVVMISIVLCFFIGQKALFSSLDVPNGDPIEGEAVLIQSTALYQKSYPEDLTSHQKKVINRVFVRKNLAKLYDPLDSDPIKSSGAKKFGLQKNGRFDPRIVPTFKEGYRYRTVTKKDIKSYKKVWIQLMVKHPQILLEAFMNQGFKYLDILSLQGSTMTEWSPDTLNLYLPKYRLPINGGKDWIIMDYGKRSLKARKVIADTYNLLHQIPPLSILLNGNLLICIVIICALILLGLKLYKQVGVLLLLLLQVPIFMLSPVNGNQRYMYPFILSLGIVIGLMIIWINKHGREKSK